jgi:hypothetical protein
MVLFGCSRDVSRSHWARMSQTDRVLYVKSMMGAEKVKDAKGGSGRAYARPAEDYVKQIDAAYARGDERDARTILSGLR